ncbi:MAG: hypothetical protein OSB46_13995 [Alphaproteobacteria bacterium]|nr:hypothetical protein [Alphaproteobacteria bacterium]
MKILSAVAILIFVWTGAASANPEIWKYEWRKTDFIKHSVPFSEILSGGSPKDSIPPAD